MQPYREELTRAEREAFRRELLRRCREHARRVAAMPRHLRHLPQIEREYSRPEKG